MKLENRKVKDLIEWIDNPRTIDPVTFDKLKRQLSKGWGQIAPLIITEDGVVLGGNMRLKAYKDLGIEEVLCSIVVADTHERKLKFALSDNDHVGKYDTDKLKSLFETTPIHFEDYEINLGNSVAVDSIIDVRPEATERDVDTDTTKEKLKDYLNNDKKQIVLYFMTTEFNAFDKRWEAIKTEKGIKKDFEVITELLRFYTSN